MPSTKALSPDKYVNDASKVTVEKVEEDLNNSLPLSIDELNEPNADSAEMPSESSDASAEGIPEADPSVPVEFLTEETVAPVDEPVLVKPEVSVEPKSETKPESDSENRV